MALAVGIANAITDKKLIFLLHFMCEPLGVIEPANRLLQSRDVGFRKAMPIIDAVMEKLVDLRTDESHDHFLKLTEETLTANGLTLTQKTGRIRRRSSLLSDSVVMSTLDEKRFENETSLLKSVHFEVIDRIICEMRNRFDHNNNILLAIAAANDIGQDDFDREKLLPLASLGLTMPSQSEISVAM